MESLLYSTVKDSQISLCVPIKDQVQVPGYNLKVFQGPFLLTLNNNQYRNEKIMCVKDLMFFAKFQINLRFLNLEYQQDQKNSTLVISNILEELTISGEDSQIHELHTAIAKYMVQRNLKRSFLKLKLMGSGSYAKVYKIQRLTDQTFFAAKAIKKYSKKFDSDTQITAILKEIEILQLLDHPNCVKLYQIFEDKRYIFLILDFLNGGDLYQELIENGEYKEILIQQVIQNLLQILAFLNSKNIMHRDIKPENIILRKKGDLRNLVLSDFGLADLVNPKAEYLFEKCGTLGYVAPEIIRGEHYDTKVDLYSLGVIMFILLSGQSPFDCNGSQDLLKLNFIGKIEFELLRKSGISAAGIDLCEKLLDPDPAKRVTILEALMHDWFVAVPADSLNQISIKLSNYKMRQSMQLQNFVKQSPLWRKNEQGDNNLPLSLESSFEGNEYELETPDRIRESRYFDQMQQSMSTLEANDDQYEFQNSPSVLMQNYRFNAKLKQ